jgi:hypothetical protein
MTPIPPAVTVSTLRGEGHRLEEQLAEMKRIWSGEDRGFAGAIGLEPERSGGPDA